MEPYRMGNVRDSLNGIIASLVMLRGLIVRDEAVPDVVVGLCRRIDGTLSRTANETITAIETALRVMNDLLRIFEARSSQELG